MRREDRFVMSHKPYAVDLSSYHTRPLKGASDAAWCGLNAVWFRRRRGDTVSCIGDLHTILRPIPEDAHEFLERFTDGRYGGSCEGRWDGTGYWGTEEPQVAAQHLELLRPMLDNYAHDPKNPVTPAGYDGWWTFR